MKIDPNWYAHPMIQAAIIAIGGAIAIWAKNLPGLVLGWAQRFFVSTITVDSRDEFLFSAFVEYMDAHPSLRSVNQFTAKSVRRGSEYQNIADDLRAGHAPRAYLSPGQGFHMLWIEGRLCWLKRDVQVAASVYERISLSHFGRTSAWLVSFLEKAMAARVARETDALSVYIPNPFHGTDWMRARLGNKRPLSSVVLKQGVAERVLSDLNDFLGARQRYAELGIPWRRGYLLYGPPGTGKTSLVAALASELHLNVCTLSLAAPVVTDEKIHSLLAGVPQRSLLLIEDVDAFFRQRDAASAQVKLSFSGFLNALDGIAAQDGTILFMTTNHIEQLDPALIRAGRIDERIALDAPDADQVRRMYLRFDPDPARAEAFARTNTLNDKSAAAIQGELLKQFGTKTA